MSHIHLQLLLAQTSANTGEIYFWLAVILIAIVIVVAVAVIVRRRVNAADDWTPDPFSLADLRRLHREGQLTDEEFERAKASIIAHTRSALHDENAENE